MRVLVVVESVADVDPMRVLLGKANIEASVFPVTSIRPAHKPTIKWLREQRQSYGFMGGHTYDYIIASGETAARFVLNTSIVNLNRLRGRDFEYKP